MSIIKYVRHGADEIFNVDMIEKRNINYNYIQKTTNQVRGSYIDISDIDIHLYYDCRSTNPDIMPFIEYDCDYIDRFVDSVSSNVVAITDKVKATHNSIDKILNVTAIYKRTVYCSFVDDDNETKFIKLDLSDAKLNLYYDRRKEC